MLELLDYWAQEPPTHVILALRYLGPGKRSKRVSEEQAKQDMNALSGAMGRAAVPLPGHLRELVRNAEQQKKQHRGL